MEEMEEMKEMRKRGNAEMRKCGNAGKGEKKLEKQFNIFGFC